MILLFLQSEDIPSNLVSCIEHSVYIRYKEINVALNLFWCSKANDAFFILLENVRKIVTQDSHGTNPGPSLGEVLRSQRGARPFDPDTKNSLRPIDVILHPYNIVLCPNDCDVIPIVTLLHAQQQKAEKAGKKFYKVRQI